MANLEGKKILFFAPKFFGYEKIITRKLSAMGAAVDYFDERPGNSFLSKAALRVHSGTISATIEKHYKKIIRTVKTNIYDFVLVVNAEAITPEIVQQLRRHFAGAKFILYMWDSVRNKNNVLHLYKYFDQTFSFDRRDAESISDIKFRPLFFCDEYAQAPVSKTLYDLSFTGTAHGDRFGIINKIKLQSHAAGLNFYTFLYLNSPILYSYKKITDKQFRAMAGIKDFAFSPMQTAEILKIFSASQVILDIQHPHQMGLTMRTFEALGMDKKIITTNTDIVNYNFYQPENISIINRENPLLDKSFFTKPYRQVPDEIKSRYSLETWLHEILVK